MPYTVDNPPAATEGLPKHAVEIFVAAFNAAFKEYKGDEGKSFATAWAAVKSKYEQDESGKWHLKERALTRRQQHSGAMVAFFLPADIARDIAIPDGEAAEELHLTLVYLGEASELNHEDVRNVVRGWASQRPPISGKIGGHAKFYTDEGDGTNALVALFDSPDLPEFRQSLMNELADLPAEQNHGFIPHITLAYVPADTPLPDITIRSDEITFDRLVLGWGGEYESFELGGDMDEDTQARSLFDKFWTGLKALLQPAERAIKDVASWDGSAANYPSTESYCNSCLIQVWEEAGKDAPTQAYCMLPVRGPGDSAGTYVRQAVHAAAGGHGISQVKRPDDVPEAAWASAVKAAAKKLATAYGQMEEEVPPSVAEMARAVSIQSIYNDILNALYPEMDDGDMAMEAPEDYLVDIYEDAGELYALVTNNGKLYRVALAIEDTGVTLGERVQVVEEHTPVATRTTVIRQADGLARWLSISATAVLNRVGEIDSAALFDSFVAHSEQTGEYPIRQFFHLGENFRTGQADFLARDGHCYITSGLYDDSELARREQAALAADPSYWGESIGYLPTGAPEMVSVGGFKIPVYRSGIHREISTLPESLAANLFTAPQIVAREVKRMLTGQRWEAFLALFQGDEAAARAWLEANPDETNRAIDGAGLITRGTETPAADAPSVTEPAPETPAAPSDIVIGEDIINEVVARAVVMPAITDLAGQLTAAQAEIGTLRTRLEDALAALNGRLTALEQSDEDKRRAFMADLPPARVARLRFEPRQARPAETVETPAPIDFAQRATQNNPLGKRY